MYENFDTAGQEKSRRWMPWALGVVCVLFLTALGLAIYFATDTGSSSNSNGGGSASSDTGVPLTNNTCLTESCVSLADAILSSIDKFRLNCWLYIYFCMWLTYVHMINWSFVLQRQLLLFFFCHFNFISNWFCFVCFFVFFFCFFLAVVIFAVLLILVKIFSNFHVVIGRILMIGN